MSSRLEAFVHGGACLRNVRDVRGRCRQRRALVSMGIGRTLLNAPPVGQDHTGPTTQDIAGELQVSRADKRETSFSWQVAEVSSRF